MKKKQEKKGEKYFEDILNDNQKRKLDLLVVSDAEYDAYLQKLNNEETELLFGKKIKTEQDVRYNVIVKLVISTRLSSKDPNLLGEFDLQICQTPQSIESYKKYAKVVQ